MPRVLLTEIERLEHVPHRTFTSIGILTFPFLIGHLIVLYSRNGAVFGDFALPLEYPEEVEAG